MSLPAIIMYLTVAFIGLPAAFRNPTAAALVLSWLAAEVSFMLTEDNLPLSIYFMADIAVIAVIYAKTIRACGAKLYSSLGEQLRCLVTDLTKCDRWIVALFVLGAWPLYVLDIHAFYKWWLLWAIVTLQFLLAGGEALTSFRAEKRKAETDTPIIDRHLVVIPFPCRAADAVRKEPSGDLLIVKGNRGYG